MKNLLCVAILVKDNIQEAVKTLSSVVKYVDHVVIYDTSNVVDGTHQIMIQICQGIPLRYESGSSVDGSTDHNKLLRMCHGLSEFVLLLETGEVAYETEPLRRTLALKRSNKKEIAFYCRTYTLYESSDRLYHKIMVVRNNVDTIAFEYPVYTQINYNNLQVSEDLCDHAFYVYHDQSRNKFNPIQAEHNVKLLEQVAQVTPVDPHIYYHLIEENRNLKRVDDLFKYCEKQMAYYEKEKLVDFIYYEHYYHALLNLGHAYAEIGNEDFYKWFLKAYKYSLFLYNNPEPFILIGKVYQQRNQLMLAYQYFKKACSIEMPQAIPRATNYKPKLYHYGRWLALSEIAFKVNKLEDYYLAKSHLT